MTIKETSKLSFEILKPKLILAIDNSVLPGHLGSRAKSKAGSNSADFHFFSNSDGRGR